MTEWQGARLGRSNNVFTWSRSTPLSIGVPSNKQSHASIHCCKYNWNRCWPATRWYSIVLHCSVCFQDHGKPGQATGKTIGPSALCTVSRPPLSGQMVSTSYSKPSICRIVPGLDRNPAAYRFCFFGTTCAKEVGLPDTISSLRNNDDQRLEMRWRAAWL